MVFIYDVATKKWFEAGRTEAMRDNLNPDWQDDVIVDYFFEEAQKFRVEVYDKERSQNFNSFTNVLSRFWILLIGFLVQKTEET